MKIFTKEFKKKVKEFLFKTQIQTDLGFSVGVNILLGSWILFGFKIAVISAFLGTIIIKIVENKKGTLNNRKR